MLIKVIVPIVAGLVLFFVVGWITGNTEYGGIQTNDDERSQLIKQKAIVSSWILLLMFLFINFIFSYFNLNQVKPNMENPELFYLVLLIISYFVYYWIYNRRLSSHEK